MLWTVTYRDGGDPDLVGITTERATADAWTTDHGDLIFYNTDETHRQGLRVEMQFPVRGFAAGTWLGVSLYA